MSLHIYLKMIPTEAQEVYNAGTTHNLSGMAKEAGIYECLWRPEEIGISKAKQLIEPLTKGLELLKSDPKRFEKFNSPNGWGMYVNFVPFVEKYLEACKNFPEADVKICDSYEEIKRTDRVFDLVVIDNNLLGTTHVEHFDLYPQLYRILKPRAFVVQNVIPDPYMYRPMVADEVQKRRKEFYSSTSDIVPLPYIVRRYHILATKNGHIVRWDHVSPWNGGGVFTHMMEILHA